MSRLIDADALKNRLEGWTSEFFDYDELIPLIDEQPTISPDEVRGVGEWITTRTWEHDGEPYCSICGFEQMHMRFEKFKYCPNCGARMKGDNNGTTD